MTVKAPAPRRRRTPRWVLCAVGFVLVASLAVAVTYMVQTYTTEQSWPKDMKGNPVQGDPRPATVREQTDGVDRLSPRRSGQTGRIGVPGDMRLKIPSTHLNTPLGAMNSVGGVMDPPGFQSAYLVRNFGSNLQHTNLGTVFVLMHSCRNGLVCPGNYLIDVAHAKARVRVGADIYVNGMHFRMTGWEKVDKPDIRNHTEVWANVPGRLVLFTCLQTPEQGKSLQNMVIYAQLVGTTGDAPAQASR